MPCPTLQGENPIYMGDYPARALVFIAPPNSSGTTSGALVVTDGNTRCPSAFVPVPLWLSTQVRCSSLAYTLHELKYALLYVFYHK